MAESRSPGLPDVILHIGPHKTGTTTIQRTLYQHRQLLLRQGICYPEAGTVWRQDGPAWRGHHNIAWQFWSEDRITADRREFRPELGDLDDAIAEARRVGARTLLLSSEDFSVIGGNGFEALMEALSRVPRVRVIMYLRSQAEWLQSNYVSLVGAGIALEFDAWVERFFATESERLDYLALADRWARLDTRGAPEVAVYEEVAGGGGLLADLLARVGLDGDVIADQPRTNVGPGARVVAAQRLFSSTFAGTMELPQHRRCLQEITAFAASHDWPQDKAWYLDQPLIDRLQDLLAAGNAAVCERYLGPGASIPVSRTQPATPGEETVPLSPGDVFELFGYLVQQRCLYPAAAPPGRGWRQLVRTLPDRVVRQARHRRQS
jgi:hypothetical protein